MQTLPQNVGSFEKSPLEVIIITGLSGGGKSTALRVFEDLGYFTVEGLPMGLIMSMAGMMHDASMQHYRGVAMAVHVDSSAPTEDMSRSMQELFALGADASMIFVEAQEAELLRRYATTRRPHPFERQGLGLEMALQVEQRHVQNLKNMADLVIDTTNYSIHDLRRVVQERWDKVQSGMHTLKVNIVSFGFKYGVPKEADTVFDVRFLPNPHFEKELRPLSGQDASIVDYVFGGNLEQKFLRQFKDFMLFCLSLIEAEGRYRYTLAIGCTGGKHRSVATAEHMHKVIKQAGYVAALEHRHLSLG